MFAYRFAFVASLLSVAAVLGGCGQKPLPGVDPETRPDLSRPGEPPPDLSPQFVLPPPPDLVATDLPAWVGEPAAVEPLALGNYHSCYLKADTSVWCWGGNTDGRLGDGTTTDRQRPVQVRGLTDVLMVSAGGFHTCALGKAGKVWCWGRNAEGQLGDGSTTDRAAPVVVVDLPGPVAEVAAGGAHTCVRTVDGKVACWGRNATGELGLGDKLDRARPTPVPGIDHVVQIAARGSTPGGGVYAYTCARRDDGTLRCWGGSVLVPMGIAVDVRDAALMAMGVWDTCIERRDHTVRCWQTGTSGWEVSNGLTPEMPEITGARQLGVGVMHGCASFEGGAVSCFGKGDNGQVGFPLGFGAARPQQLPKLAGVAGLAVGGYHSCVRLLDGQVQCWGRNFEGQLGDGTRDSRMESKTVIF